MNKDQYSSKALCAISRTNLKLNKPKFNNICSYLTQLKSFQSEHPHWYTTFWNDPYTQKNANVVL